MIKYFRIVMGYKNAEENLFLKNARQRNFFMTFLSSKITSVKSKKRYIPLLIYLFKSWRLQINKGLLLTPY